MLVDTHMEMAPRHGASAIPQLRAALAGSLTADERFRVITLLAPLLGQTLRASEAADLLEDQLPAFDGRPDLQQAIELVLADVTRLDPSARRRGVGVLERLKHRVQDRGERDPHAMAILAAELAIAGASADATAELAERALAHGAPSRDALEALIVADRYEAAARALVRTRDRESLALRSVLHLRMGTPAAAEADARAALALSTGRPLAEERAAACLAEALIERGELDEPDRLLADVRFAGPAVMLARGRLRLAQGRIDDAVDDLYECGRRALVVDILN